MSNCENAAGKCNEAPSVNSRPFLMSRVWGSTDPNTSVPMIASVTEARSQTSMGNSVSNPMNNTTQLEHPDTQIPVPLAPHNVFEVHPNVPTGAPA